MVSELVADELPRGAVIAERPRLDQRYPPLAVHNVQRLARERIEPVLAVHLEIAEVDPLVFHLGLLRHYGVILRTIEVLIEPLCDAGRLFRQ